MCGKWKSLTAQYARQSGSAVDVSVCVGTLAQNLVVVLFLFGANMGVEDLYRTTVDSFEGSLTEVVSLALKLQKATKEDVLSTDFQLLLPTYGDTFEQETMEDVNARPKWRSRKSGGGQQPILCTTDVGLSRTERRSEVSGGPWEAQSVIMLKSRVALASVIADLGH